MVHADWALCYVSTRSPNGNPHCLQYEVEESWVQHVLHLR